MPDSEKEKCMKMLKRRMEAWREIILPMNSIILWEKNWYPGLILGVTTTLFLSVWILDPAFLTIISILLLLTAVIDYSARVLSSMLVSSSNWTGQKEKKLEEICSNLSESMIKIQTAWKCGLGVRNNRPTLFYGCITICLTFLAWLGNVVNNLLLIYAVVNILLLLPGMKHKGRGQSAVTHLFKSIFNKKQA